MMDSVNGARVEKDSLGNLPAEGCVFGIFAMIDEAPVNCRYVGESENLSESVRALFEHPAGAGIGKFMQGPWIKMVQYELMSGSSKEEREKVVKEWRQRYKPGIDEDGDYPGYY
jgi:hypothetical protein